MAEDELNEAPKEADATTDSAPAKKKAVRKRVPAKSAAVKKKVVTKKKAAPKKKAARKRSITPKQKVAPAEPVVAVSAEANTAPVIAEESNQGHAAEPMQASGSLSNQDDQARTISSDGVAGAAESGDQPVIAEAEPKRNENVQKRLEEMGLMPSDSTEKQTPPPTKSAAKGLGFWQKSFIWTIVVVAGLLYIRNVANNGDSVEPEIATVGQTEAVTTSTTDAANQPIAPANNASDAVDEKQASPTTSMAVVSETPKPELQASTTEKAIADVAESTAASEQKTETVTADQKDAVDSPVQVVEAAVQESVDQVAKEGLSIEQPKRLMDKLTSMIMGSDSSKSADAKEEETQIVSETPSEAATASTITSMQSPAPTQADSVQPDVSATAESAVTRSASSTSADQSKGKYEESVPVSSEAVVSEGAAVTTEPVTADAAPTGEASKTTSQAMPFSSMPRNMVRMMPSYQGRPNLNRNRFNYPAPAMQPRMQNRLSQAQQGQSIAPPQRDFYRYRAPAYPLQFNQPVAPYYGPYPVRPPVYGPVVRYPYLQTPPPVR